WLNLSVDNLCAVCLKQFHFFKPFQTAVQQRSEVLLRNLSSYRQLRRLKGQTSNCDPYSRKQRQFLVHVDRLKECECSIRPHDHVAPPTSVEYLRIPKNTSFLIS